MNNQESNVMEMLLYLNPPWKMVRPSLAPKLSTT